MNPSVLVVGCGSMGGALFQRWAASGLYAVQGLDPSVSWAHHHVKDILDFSPEIVVLAVKPQDLRSAIDSCAALLSEQCLVISIAAGISLKELQAMLPPGTPCVRTMPNLPARVGRGLTALFSPPLGDDHQDQVVRLFNQVGKTVWVESEDQMDHITALSGSGPAYFFYLAETLRKIAIDLGLSPEICDVMVTQTLSGAGALAEASPDSVAVLCQRVTSPGGTTQAALTILEGNGFEELVKKAVEAAVERAKELRANT